MLYLGNFTVRDLICKDVTEQLLFSISLLSPEPSSTLAPADWQTRSFRVPRTQRINFWCSFLIWLAAFLAVLQWQSCQVAAGGGFVFWLVLAWVSGELAGRCAPRRFTELLCFCRAVLFQRFYPFLPNLPASFKAKACAKLVLSTMYESCTVHNLCWA